MKQCVLSTLNRDELYVMVICTVYASYYTHITCWPMAIAGTQP